MLFIKKVVLTTIIISLMCFGLVFGADPLLIFDDIPTSLLVYKYLTLTMGLIFFCIVTPFISWYFKHRKNEQERLEKIYTILCKNGICKRLSV